MQKIYVVVALFIVFQNGVCGNSHCELSDADIELGIDSSNVAFTSDCRWYCNVIRTGKKCETRECNAVCDKKGQRKSMCLPPAVGNECIACYQDQNEASREGYSFNALQNDTRKYDFLSSHGSFEHSKFIRPQEFILNAVDTSKLEETRDTAWADIMYNAESPVFSGAGHIDLHHSGTSNLGASNSKVYVELSAPYARLSVCNMNLGPRARNVFNSQAEKSTYIHGLVYEFQYRQRLAFEDTIEMDVTLWEDQQSKDSNNPDVIYHYLYKTDKIQLDSVEKWQHFRGQVEFSNLLAEPKEVGNSVCMQLGFEMLLRNEMLFDELFVFGNLIGNQYWKSMPSGTGIQPSDVIPLLPGQTIFQAFQLNPSGSRNDKLGAIFSLQVQGSGTLHVLYTEPYRSGDMGDTIIYKAFTIDLDQDDEWQTLRVPVTMVVYIAETDLHQITIRNHASFGNLTIRNIMLYVDPRRCPVHQCDDYDKRIFLNGVCELCDKYTDSRPNCIKGQRQTGCIVEQNGIQPNCTNCATVLTAIDQINAGGKWVDSPTQMECTWECVEGYWFSRTGGISGNPVCKTCTPLHSLRCNIGWYAANCSTESDAVCLPCDLLDRYNNSVIYTTSNSSSTILYGARENVQCKYECAPGHFQYSERSNNGIPMCFPCTQSVCAAEDDGILSLRTLDGLQYTQKCADTRDSRCQICESNDPAVIFNANGVSIGDWCTYECAAGSTPCGTCQWDPFKSVIVNTTKIHFHQRLMVRFRGILKFNSARFGTQFTINIHVRAENILRTSLWYPSTETILRVSPVVSPQSIANMQKNVKGNISHPIEQVFDVMVEARDFINTAKFSEWNKNTVSHGSRLFFGL